MIDKRKLNIKAKEVLEASGWDETRSITEMNYPKDFSFPEHVKNILISLYGLNIKTKPREIVEENSISCFYGDLEFFPENAAGENENGTFGYFSKMLHKNFYPLGEITNGFFYIALDDNECLYLLGDNIIKLGDNFYQGLYMLLIGIKGKELNDETLEWKDY